MGLFLKNHLLRCCGWLSHLNWIGTLTSLLLKSTSKKIGALICSMKFRSPEVALYLYKSTIQPCMEYWCQVWVGAWSSYLEFLDKLQKWIGRTVGFSLTTSLELLAQHWNVASLSLLYRYYFGRCSTGFTSFFLREVYSLFW